MYEVCMKYKENLVIATKNRPHCLTGLHVS